MPTSPAGSGPGSPRLQILGPLRLWRSGTEFDTGPRQQTYLLALLMARAGRTVSTGELIDLIWDDAAPASAVNVIHKYIGALRRLLEPALPPREAGSFIRRSGNGYRFRAGPEVLDLAAFRDRAALVRPLREQGRDQEALTQALAALDRWTGPAGDGLLHGPSSASVFTALDREFLDVCVATTGLALSLGQAQSVLRPLRLASALAPLHEPVQASLITALAAAGQQAESIAVYQTAGDRLVSELGVGPGPVLQAARQQVIDRSPEHSGPVPPPPAGPLTLPPLRPAQLPPGLTTFVGRTAELERLTTLLAGMWDDRRTGPLTVALDGLGGIGKSTLAVQFAHQVADRFTDGQLYLDLRGYEEDSVSPEEALLALSSSLGLHLPSAEPLETRIGIYRSLTAGRRVLILLDNARDVAHVRPLLPNSPDSLILVTSRQPLTGLAAFDGAHLLHLGLPDLASACEILRRRLERSPHRGVLPAGSAQVLEEIIGLCGRLPLALAVLAGRLSARPHLSLEAVADELRHGTNRLAAFPGEPGTSDPRTAFAWSYRQLTPAAARLFRLLSVAVAPGITVDECAGLAGEPLRTTQHLLDELVEAALLRESRSGRYSSHVLVQAYAGELFQAVETKAEQEAAATRLLQHYLHSSGNAARMLAPPTAPMTPPVRPGPPPAGVTPARPASYAEGFDWFAGRLHLLRAMRHAAEETSRALPWQFALSVETALERGGHFEDWRDIAQLARQTALDQGDRNGLAHTRWSLAGALHRLGDHTQARDLLGQALTFFSTAASPGHEAAVRQRLHLVHTALGEPARALREIDAVLTHRRSGPAFAARARSLLDLGLLDEARRSAEMSGVLAREQRRPTDVPGARTVLAQYLLRIGEPEPAATQLGRALREALTLRDRPAQFEIATLLADTRLTLGQVDTACRAWRQACDAMHAMQNTGTRTMHATVRTLGNRLSEVSDFPPPALTGRRPIAGEVHVS